MIDYSNFEITLAKSFVCLVHTVFVCTLTVTSRLVFNGSVKSKDPLIKIAVVLNRECVELKIANVLKIVS